MSVCGVCGDCCGDGGSGGDGVVMIAVVVRNGRWW